jgi:hypothetical protein
MGSKGKFRPHWELTSGLFEVFWKPGPKGVYADRIRICGATFFYISGKKATIPDREAGPARGKRKP